ncbi:putative methyltransferase [Capillimicrobium parvum]|uniref:Methyltransferase n=1 Tax=Capillimicrobium parvum TaxID=2884022 RepID=A0A9E6XZM8_9ACTN|nr:putative methyltransferase [Capillimicrobium parvum]
MTHVHGGGRLLCPAVSAAARTEPPVEHGLARIRQLWTLFRNEQTDPEPFYTVLAREAVADLDRRYGPLRGQRIVDLGSGPGFYARAFRNAGADCIPVDNSRDELELAGAAPENHVLADAADLPFEDESVDGVFASNLLEHAPDTAGIIGEIERVLKPGGWAYVSWTNWYSPWGGHDMSPYHLLGPERGPALYERRHGEPRKNTYGEGLFAVHIGPTLRLVRQFPRLRIERVEPRYWPKLRFIVAIPGLREVATWNCVIRLRKR